MPANNRKHRQGEHADRTDGSVALRRDKHGRRNLDVVSSESFIPFRWQRKTGSSNSVIESFYHAFHGIRVGLQGERNLRIHFACVVLVPILGFALKIDMVSWLALVIVMGFVISAEFVNTALEHLVDISADGQYRYAARCAKDTAAAGVLVAAITAVITGALVFIPRIVALF